MKKQAYKTRQWDILEDNFPELFGKINTIKWGRGREAAGQRRQNWELYYSKRDQNNITTNRKYEY